MAALNGPEMQQAVVANAAPLILAKKIKKESQPKKPIVHKLYAGDLALDMPKPVDWDTMPSGERLNEKQGEYFLSTQRERR